MWCLGVVADRDLLALTSYGKVAEVWGSGVSLPWFLLPGYAHLVVASSARFVQDWESQVSFLKGSGDHELAAVSDPRAFFYVRGCKFQGPQTSKDTRYTDPRPVPSPPGKMSFGARRLGFRALSLCLNQKAFWLFEPHFSRSKTTQAVGRYKSKSEAPKNSGLYHFPICSLCFALQPVGR